MPKQSPMMSQYYKVKNEHPDCIVFFRLGDFYEMFFEDAQLASRELELTLTGRDCGQEERAPMCGIPFHSSEAYIARLIEKGYKVAICEQLTDPKETKGLVERGVIRIVTPGTVIESNMLNDECNNYICALCLDALGAGLCFADVTTGEFSAIEFTDGDIFDEITSELGKFNPSEIMLNAVAAEDAVLVQYIKDKLGASIESGREDFFEAAGANDAILSHFGKKNCRDVGFRDSEGRLTRAAGALIAYLHYTQKNELSHIKKIDFYKKSQFMQVDNTARRNLELIETMRNKEKVGSLLWVLDKTKTAMGGRLIRQWVSRPLLDISEIDARLSAVATLVEDSYTRNELREELRKVLDIERIATRVSCGSASPRDLKSMEQALRALPRIREILSELENPALRVVYDKIDELTDIFVLIENAITDEPPAITREGGMIKAGYNEEIDKLHGIMSGGNDFLAKIETAEREKTGIKNLKIGYNRVFGYYIEISKSNTAQAPESYVRKQTLANGERYITQELKEMEATILGAKERVIALEIEVYKAVCAEIAAANARVHETSQAIAVLDVLASFATVAVSMGYSRPIITDGNKLIIEDGRHPVVELMLRDAQFVPNDTAMDCGDDRMAVITGPNMAGKSTYMRQVALIVLMAQIGSFVPARYAEIGLVDKIFTRIGASDDLASGQSTFMVEMSEVADIIKNATSKSLILLDEIGRGTSTFDGMAIARAVVEYVANKERIGAKTLFATHYHELTELEGQVSGVKNYNIAAKKHGFDITFLRKIVRGGADDSYGIEVAKLAGIPESVIRRSKEILTSLESGDSTYIPSTSSTHDDELLIQAEHAVADRLRSVDINAISPLEAHKILQEFAQEVTK